MLTILVLKLNLFNLKCYSFIKLVELLISNLVNISLLLRLERWWSCRNPTTRRLNVLVLRIVLIVLLHLQFLIKYRVSSHWHSIIKLIRLRIGLRIGLRISVGNIQTNISMLCVVDMICLLLLVILELMLLLVFVCFLFAATLVLAFDYFPAIDAFYFDATANYNKRCRYHTNQNYNDAYDPTHAYSIDSLNNGRYTTGFFFLLKNYRVNPISHHYLTSSVLNWVHHFEYTCNSRDYSVIQVDSQGY